MSYLVLARKYRPRSFDTLVGQEHVVQALVNALERQRLHHAYLFAGTRGVGKTTVSRVLAKALNCTGADGAGGITAEPCNACAACRDIDSGRFADYVELDAASNRGVDEITQLLDQAVYKPVAGRFKVYMIDEVHMLSNHAFNAMLKTLEEPPEYLKFVLATTDPQKVPPTVLSRCLQFNLRPMSPQTVEAHLHTVLEAEGIASEAGARRLLARAARGSMRDALSLADQAIAHGAGALSEPAVRQMLGAVDRSHALRLLEALAAADGASLVTAAGELRSLGLSAAGTLEEMAETLQQLAVLQAVPAAADPAAADAAALTGLAGRIAADALQLYYGMCLHGRAELALAPDEHGGLLMVLLRMLAFGSGAGAAVERSAANGRLQAAAIDATAAAAVGAESMPPSPAGRATVPLRASQAATATVAAPRPKPQRGDGEQAAAAPEVVRPVDRARPAVPSIAQPAGEMPPESPAAALGASSALAVDRPPASLPVAPAASPDEAGRPVDEPAATGDAAAPAADAAAGPVDADGAADTWNRTVMALCAGGRIGALTRELALQSQCIDILDDEGGAVWRLMVEREALRTPGHLQKLERALAEHLGTPVRLQVDVGAVADSPALRAAAERLRRQQEAERTIGDDPLVRSLLQQFKTARIVPGSVRPC